MKLDTKATLPIVSDRLIPFHPHPLVRGGHLQTIVGYYLPQTRRFKAHAVHMVELSDGDRLALLENKPGRRAPFKKILVLMHGLGGEDSSPYMVRLADLFVKRGWTVFRMNHRGCGAGQGLAKGLYHSGRSDDISAVLQFIAQMYPKTPVFAVGFSLSGNALLKLLGERRFPLPENLRGAMAVTPPIDLARCAAALSRKQNRIYDLRFIRMLKQALHERRQAFPDFPEFRFPRRMTLRDFDEICTAPLNGFRSAADYYAQCSADQFLNGIKVPTVLLASLDDPFIPSETYANVRRHPFLEVILTKSGGHMGFVARDKTPLFTRRWMDYALVFFAEAAFKEPV